MKKIFIGLRNYDFPTHWNEFTQKQLLYVAKLLSLELSKEDIVVALTAFFAGMNMRELERINPYIFKELEHQYNFLFKKIKLTKQLLPKIKLRLKSFEGPLEGLSDFTYERFIIFSETYFNGYISTKDETYLDLLIATLYVRKGKRFSVDEIENNAVILSKLSDAYKTAILLFYQGSRNFFATKFPQLFPTKEEKQKTENYDFLRVIELLNKGDVSKNNEIKNINIYEIFTNLVKLYEDDKKNK